MTIDLLPEIRSHVGSHIYGEPMYQSYISFVVELWWSRIRWVEYIITQDLIEKQLSPV